MRFAGIVFSLVVAFFMQSFQHLIAVPDPACYRLNPNCTRTEGLGGVNCPAGEEAWLIRADAQSRCKDQQTKVAVRDFLLERGEFPDDLTVDYNIEVSFKPTKQQVGKLFSLTAQLESETSADKESAELLVLANNKIIPVLKQWEGNDHTIHGIWQGSQIKFDSLFLTQDLPQEAQLVFLMRNKHGGSKFHIQTRPFSSSSAKYNLSTISYETVSYPPRLRFTLSFTSDVPKGTLFSYYVVNEYGDQTDKITVSPPRPTSSTATLLGERYRLADDGCFTLVVGIRPPERGKSYDIVTAPFGNDCK